MDFIFLLFLSLCMIFWGVRGRLHIQRVSMLVNPWFRDVGHFVLTCMKSDMRDGHLEKA